jgi:hypothetical protein
MAFARDDIVEHAPPPLWPLGIRKGPSVNSVFENGSDFGHPEINSCDVEMASRCVFIH